MSRSRVLLQIFQSTLPAGEATASLSVMAYSLSISIHASRGGSDDDLKTKMQKVVISIHASRGGSDNME